MIARIRKRFEQRRLDRAQALIESYGLTIVKIQNVGDTKYLVNADGTFMRLVERRK